MNAEAPDHHRKRYEEHCTMAETNRSKATKAARDPAAFAYADNVYQSALDKAAKKVRSTIDAEREAAYRFLRKQGINITHEQVSEYYKRH